MGSGERIFSMSSFSETKDYYINPAMVTHISFSIEDATVHFVGGDSRVISKDEAEKVVSELDEWSTSARLRNLEEILEHKLMGRLDDITTTLAQGFEKL